MDYVDFEGFAVRTGTVGIPDTFRSIYSTIDQWDLPTTYNPASLTIEERNLRPNLGTKHQAKEVKGKLQNVPPVSVPQRKSPQKWLFSRRIKEE